MFIILKYWIIAICQSVLHTRGNWEKILKGVAPVLQYISQYIYNLNRCVKANNDEKGESTNAWCISI